MWRKSMSLRLLGFDRQGIVVVIDGQDTPVCIANLVEDGLPAGLLVQGDTNLAQPMGGRLTHQPSGGKVCLVPVGHVQALVEGQNGNLVHVVDGERLERLAGGSVAGFAGFAHAGLRGFAVGAHVVVVG